MEGNESKKVAKTTNYAKLEGVAKSKHEEKPAAKQGHSKKGGTRENHPTNQEPG